jgi:hypothetical protein
MKIRNFVIIAAVIAISAAFTSCRSLVRVKGNGNIVTSERAVLPFEKIQIRGSAVVNYHASLEYRVVVTIDSNLEEYTRVYTEGNELKIGTKREKGKSYSFTNYIVDVYCPKLSAVSVSGSVLFNGIDKINASTFALTISGSGKVNGTFECENFTTRISGSGDIESHIECNKFEASISGAGKITVTGSAKDMNVSGSGSMTFTGNEFQTNSALVRIGGSGRMQIWVLDYLKATVSGSGRITYRGNPKIDYTGSGSGRLRSEA